MKRLSNFGRWFLWGSWAFGIIAAFTGDAFDGATLAAILLVCAATFYADQELKDFERKDDLRRILDGDEK